MRYYFDTEFIEDGKTIDLISIGIVAEDGREYYAISHEFNPCKASQWVRDNVLIHLPPAPRGCRIFDKVAFPAILNPSANYWIPEVVDMGDPSVAPSIKELAMQWKSREQIAKDIIGFVLDLTGSPEFWAYYANYDWVAFCQLFGPMPDLPKEFPMYCWDLKQEADRMGIDLSEEVPQKNEHHALYDARWNKRAYEYLLNGCLQ